VGQNCKEWTSIDLATPTHTCSVRTLTAYLESWRPCML